MFARDDASVKASLSRNEFYLEDVAPQLACNEESAVGRIIALCSQPGDTVQHSLGPAATSGSVLDKAAEIDDAVNLSCNWIDAHDLLRHPDVRPHLAIDVFKLVQITDGVALQVHRHFVLHLERFRIEELQRVAAIAQDQVCAVPGEPPPFRRVVVRSHIVESVDIVDKGDVRLPGQLVNMSADDGDAFAEVAAAQALAL